MSLPLGPGAMCAGLPALRASEGPKLGLGCVHGHPLDGTLLGTSAKRNSPAVPVTPEGTRPACSESDQPGQQAPTDHSQVQRGKEPVVLGSGPSQGLWTLSDHIRPHFLLALKVVVLKVRTPSPSRCPVFYHFLGVSCFCVRKILVSHRRWAPEVLHITSLRTSPPPRHLPVKGLNAS